MGSKSKLGEILAQTGDGAVKKAPNTKAAFNVEAAYASGGGHAITPVEYLDKDMS